jgi:hypothetical protein
MPVDELKAHIYDQMPPSKTAEATARIIGAAVFGRGNVFSLRLESEALRKNRLTAVTALQEVMRLDASVDLGPTEYLDLSLGQFRGGVDGTIAAGLAEVTEAFASDRILTFAPISNPHEQVQA